MSFIFLETFSNSYVHQINITIHVIWNENTSLNDFQTVS